MPQGIQSSIPPGRRGDHGLALVVRFHGHNDKMDRASTFTRASATCSAERAQSSGSPKLTSLAEEAERSDVLMNNCYADYATTNATELSELYRASGLEVSRGHSLTG